MLLYTSDIIVAIMGMDHRKGMISGGEAPSAGAWVSRGVVLPKANLMMAALNPVMKFTDLVKTSFFFATLRQFPQ